MDSSASGPSSVVATPRLDTGTQLAEPRTLLALMEKPDRKEGRVENRKQERKVDQRRFKGEAEAQLLDLAAQKSKDQEEGRKMKRQEKRRRGRKRKEKDLEKESHKKKEKKRKKKKERKGAVDRRSAVKQRMERNRQGGELVVLELQPAGSATEEVRAGPRSSALKHMRSS